MTRLYDAQCVWLVPFLIPLPTPPLECLLKSTPTLVSIKHSGDFAMGALSGIEGVVSTAPSNTKETNPVFKVLTSVADRGKEK